MKQKDKLTAAQYWEWRNSITTLWLKQKELAIADYKLSLLLKDIQLLDLTAKLHKASVVKIANDELGQAQSDYNIIKERLEKYLGQSLNGKVIDDITYEIKALEEKDTK